MQLVQLHMYIPLHDKAQYQGKEKLEPKKWYMLLNVSLFVIPPIEYYQSNDGR